MVQNVVITTESIRLIIPNRLDRGSISHPLKVVMLERDRTRERPSGNLCIIPEGLTDTRSLGLNFQAEEKLLIRHVYKLPHSRLVA